jgi:hypothetical protein
MTNALNLREINQETTLNLMKFSISMERNFFIFGSKGTGKSEIAIQAIKESGFKVNYINLSVLDRCDLMGYPRMNSPSKTVSFKLPSYLPPLEGKPDSVILFDEADKASPDVMAPLLEILQFRSINHTPLNIVSCILTGNLPEEKVYANQISSALLDRTSKYILNFDLSLWIDWAKSNNVHDLILGFLRYHPEFATGRIDESVYASPSPRGWTLASQALLKSKEINMTDIESVTQIISGYVGSEAGLRFKIWYEHYKQFIPYIQSLIEQGQMSLNFDELVPTEKVVFVVAACHHAKLKMLSEKSKNKFVYLERLCLFFNNYKIDSEVQIMGLHNSFNLEQVAMYKLYQCKPFYELFSKLSDGVTFKK